MHQKKKTGRSITRGTLAMLLLTAACLLASLLFLLLIAGETLQSRAGEVETLLAETGTTLLPEEQGGYMARERERAAQIKPRQPEETALPAAAQPRGQQPVTLTIAAAGAVHAPKPVRAGAQTDAGEYDFSAVFAGLGDALAGADLALATLETVTAGEEKGYGSHNAPAALLDALRARGIDVLSLGTEHALDRGADGLLLTRGEMTARGITGAGLTAGNGRTDLLNVGGVQVAVLAYTYGLSEEGKEETAPAERGAVRRLDMDAVVRDIRQARADGANVVIVMPHWGTKNRRETPDELRDMAREMAAAGADLILGSHPNVVQGTERITVTRADGIACDAVVCYSLGSLLTDARTEENTAGMIARVQVTYDPQTRRTAIGQLACLPVYIARETQDGQTVYRVVDVENAQAVASLSEAEQQAAQRAAQIVRSITGQSEMEGEGEG